MTAPTEKSYRILLDTALQFLLWMHAQEKTDEFWTQAALHAIALTDQFAPTPLAQFCNDLFKAVLEEAARQTL